MKKFLSGLVICIFALGFITCGDGGDTHSHSFSSEWSSDYSQHWKECDCGAKSQVANHGQKPCNTCGYVVVPMFFWGNYIPEKVRLASQMVSAGNYFSIDELVANVANARKKYEIDFDNADWDNWNYEDADTIIVNSDGSKVVKDTNCNTEIGIDLSLGDLIWQEIKSNEPAVKADKTITMDSTLGYAFFVAPASFGNVIVREGDNTDISSTWSKHTATIDGLEYNVYRKTGAMTTPSKLLYIFDFT